MAEKRPQTCEARHTDRCLYACAAAKNLYKQWNFWTEDADQVQAILNRFDKVNVIYGHVHQIQYNQIGNIAFTSVMSTGWPVPYPESYAQVGSHLPMLTVPMNRADPFDDRDATGWQFVNVHTGRVDLAYNLYSNENRTVAFNEQNGYPEDTRFANLQHRTAPIPLLGDRYYDQASYDDDRCIGFASRPRAGRRIFKAGCRSLAGIL